MNKSFKTSNILNISQIKNRQELGEFIDSKIKEKENSKILKENKLLRKQIKSKVRKNAVSIQ